MTVSCSALIAIIIGKSAYIYNSLTFDKNYLTFKKGLIKGFI